MQVETTTRPSVKPSSLFAHLATRILAEVYVDLEGDKPEYKPGKRDRLVALSRVYAPTLVDITADTLLELADNLARCPERVTSDGKLDLETLKAFGAFEIFCDARLTYRDPALATLAG